MTIQGQLLEMLETVAAAVGDDLCNQMVFVGGCSTAILVTDEITLQEVRATDDVDLIVDLSGIDQWMHLQERLLEKGFTVSSEDGIICRMRLGNLKVDFRFLGSQTAGIKRGSKPPLNVSCPVGDESNTLLRRFF
jgi:hypothetical protein